MGFLMVGSEDSFSLLAGASRFSGFSGLRIRDRLSSVKPCKSNRGRQGPMQTQAKDRNLPSVHPSWDKISVDDAFDGEDGRPVTPLLVCMLGR